MIIFNSAAIELERPFSSRSFSRAAEVCQPPYQENGRAWTTLRSHFSQMCISLRIPWELTPIWSERSRGARFRASPMAVLLTIRTDFLCFGSKIVEQSRYFPAGSHEPDLRWLPSRQGPPFLPLRSGQPSGCGYQTENASSETDLHSRW